MDVFAHHRTSTYVVTCMTNHIYVTCMTNHIYDMHSALEGGTSITLHHHVRAVRKRTSWGQNITILHVLSTSIVVYGGIAYLICCHRAPISCNLCYSSDTVTSTTRSHASCFRRGYSTRLRALIHATVLKKPQYTTTITINEVQS